MKRPAGLIASTVVLALVSLLQVAMALLMAAAAEFSPKAALSARAGAPAVSPPPAWLPIFMYGLAVLFLGLAIWGIATAVGLHRLRNWARLSVLVIGGGMAVIGFFSALAMLAVMFMPLPASAAMGANQAHATQIMVRAVLAFIALFYAGVLAVGIWWLVYFNRRNVRALFINAQGELEESRRPLLVSLFAVLLFVGAPFCAVMAFLPFPSLMFGLVLEGWEKTLFFLLYAAISACTGIGLWHLKEWGRRLALALMAVGVINCSIYAFFPSLFSCFFAKDCFKASTS